MGVRYPVSVPQSYLMIISKLHPFFFTIAARRGGNTVIGQGEKRTPYHRVLLLGERLKELSYDEMVLSISLLY